MADKIDHGAGHFQRMLNDLLDVFINGPWSSLQQASSPDEAEAIVADNNLGNHVVVMPSTKFPQGFKLQWIGECPSCQDYEFPHPQPALGQDFAALHPSIKTNIIKLVYPSIDDITGEPCTRKAKVIIHTLNPVISREEESTFIGRYCDTIANNEHVH